MLKLTTQKGVFGPYVNVETLEYRYRVDGADLPFTVVGTGAVEPWIGPMPTPDPPELTRAQKKAQRELSVAAIKVTTPSGTWDGDEESQTRMARAILALQATGTASTIWVLADNSVIQATAAELTEALVLAGQAQAALWVIE